MLKSLPEEHVFWKIPVMMIKGTSEKMPKNSPGVLYITNKRVSWVEKKSGKALSLKLPWLSHCFTWKKENACFVKFSNVSNGSQPGFIFAFQAPADDETGMKAFFEIDVAFKRLIAKPVLKDAPTVSKKRPLSSPTPAFIPNKSVAKKSSNNLNLAKVSLLKRPDIERLHNSLVGSGIISSEEFWEQRMHLLHRELTNQQTAGLPSELLADIRPTKRLHNKTFYTLNAEKIRDMFAKDPSLRRRYEEQVPTKVTEAEFWSAHFESKSFAKTGDTVGSTNGAVASLGPVNYLRSVVADPQVDLSKNADGGSVGFGVAPICEKESGTLSIEHQKNVVEIADMFNKHGAQTLTQSGMSENRDSWAKALSCDDYEERPREEVMRLTLNPSDAAEEEEEEEGEGADVEALDMWKKLEVLNLHLPNAFECDDGWRRLRVLSAQMSSETDRSSAANVPSRVFQPLKDWSLASAEALRHFWSSHRIVRTSSRPRLVDAAFAKMRRLVGRLEELQTELHGWVEAEKDLYASKVTARAFREAECAHRGQRLEEQDGEKETENLSVLATPLLRQIGAALAEAAERLAAAAPPLKRARNGT